MPTVQGSGDKAASERGAMKQINQRDVCDKSKPGGLSGFERLACSVT